MSKITKIKVNNVNYDLGVDYSNVDNKPDLSLKQDTLVSGANIKTINNQSILGSGNINTGTYSKPSGGIPKSDLASSVQSSLNKADTALQTEQYTGTYSKPSGGIPKTDLASAVQTSLSKADTALQSYTEQYTGTITGITMNGSSKGTSGVVDLGTVITQHQDISGKQDVLSSTNKLSADYVDDTNKTHKFVTELEKTVWNNKSNFSGNYNDLTNKPTIPTVNNKTITIQMNGSTVDSFTTNASSNKTIDLGTVITSHQDISGKLDTSKVKNANSTTAGDVYDVRYINTMLGNIESLLSEV